MMTRMIVAGVLAIVVTLAGAAAARAQDDQVEVFDVSGLPQTPSTPEEQALLDLLRHRRLGDIHGAVLIQQRLAEYYAARGDAARARVAAERARATEPKAGGISADTTAAARRAVAGEYLCRSRRARPCAAEPPLRLAEDGTWTWARAHGDYEVDGDQVRFRGAGGAATWGAAAVGPDALTFPDGDGTAVWQRPGAKRADLDGTYHCQIAIGTCANRASIELRGDRWSWGSEAGTFVILDNGTRIRFSGARSGPVRWGLADIGGGVLIFHDDRNGESVWRKD